MVSHNMSAQYLFHWTVSGDPGSLSGYPNDPEPDVYKGEYIFQGEGFPTSPVSGFQEWERGVDKSVHCILWVDTVIWILE